MSTLAIEINDAGIQMRSRPAPAVGSPPPVPGYALLEQGQIVTGREATAQMRLHPRNVTNHFWCDLDTVPLQRPFPGHLSHADLVHAQLSRIWNECGDGIQRVILAVPGSSTNDQLGLLLGISRAAGMPVEGLVDSAVAASAVRAGGVPSIHLDLQLHRVVATELLAGTDAVRGRVGVIRHFGQAALEDAWAKQIARMFVATTRFDPFHGAATDQALYERLPGILEGLAREPRVNFEIERSGRRHEIQIDRAEIVAEAESRYSEIARLVGTTAPAGGAARLWLSCRAARLPGLERYLEEGSGAVIATLPAEAAVEGALQGMQAIVQKGESLTLVVRLGAHVARQLKPPERAARSESGAEASPATRNSSRPPTHLLFGERAHRLTAEPLILGSVAAAGRRAVQLCDEDQGVSPKHCSVFVRDGRAMVENHSADGTVLNGGRITGRVELSVGDRLRFGTGEVELRLIEVVNPGGTPDD